MRRRLRDHVRWSGSRRRPATSPPAATPSPRRRRGARPRPSAAGAGRRRSPRAPRPRCRPGSSWRSRRSWPPRSTPAASARSAVSSTTCTALPTPTPKAGVPELYAAFTMPAPPVATIRSTWCISSWVSAIFASGSTCTRSAGAPTCSHASRMSPTTASVVPLAARVRGEDDRVAAGERAQRLDRRRRVGPGGGDQAATTPDRLGDLHQPARPGPPRRRRRSASRAGRTARRAPGAGSW